MIPMLLLAGALIAIVIILLIGKKRSAPDIVDTVITCLMFFCVGLGGLWAFAGHAFMADRVAAMIGWPAGSPFQAEVAAANLAFAILGLFAARAGHDFRRATALGYALFLLGAAVVHVREIVMQGNRSAYNAGFFIFVGDVVVPLTLLALVMLQGRLGVTVKNRS